MHPITDPDVLAGYLRDASNLQGRAEGLFRPGTTAEVAAIVAEAQRTRTPLLVVAGQTSTTAAAVPEGGWVLSTERLRQIHHIGHHRATADAGILLGDFQDAIEAAGRFYPPDPTSRRDCTLGATVATNASGARSFKYGPTRPWVEQVEVVLPDGSIRQVDRDTPIPDGWPVPHWATPAVKSSIGFVPTTNLLDLLIGSEGTLGIITRVTVRLTDLPHAVLGFFAFFPDRPRALSFVRAARAAREADPDGALAPRCLEYLDHNCLALAGTRVGSIPAGARVALFCEQELTLDEDAHLEAWLAALEQHGALVDDTLVTTDDAGRAALHALRHAVPAGINEQVARNGMPKVGTDLAVPDHALDALFDLYERAPLPHALFGHVGDNHLHLNLLPSTPAELEQALAFYDELARAAVAMGGTVSAEHGIGKRKRHHLRLQVGDAVIAQFQRLKRHVDPHWILARGNLVEPTL